MTTLYKGQSLSEEAIIEWVQEVWAGPNLELEICIKTNVFCNFLAVRPVNIVRHLTQNQVFI